MSRGHHNCTGIILSAGASSRMGQPKALLSWQGQPLVSAHCESLRRVCSRVIVVLGAESAAIERVIDPDIEVRHNPDWAVTHMADSLRVALAGLKGPCIVTPIDTPPVPEDILRLLVDQPAPLVPTYGGKDGHPVWIDAETTHVALSASPLNHFLRNAPRLSVGWAGCIATWNTPTEWEAQLSSTEDSRASKSDS